jgi:hypothetical protein
MKSRTKKCPSCKKSVPAKQFDSHVFDHIREGKLIGIQTWIPNVGSNWKYLPGDTLQTREKARAIFEFESSRRHPEGTVVRLLDATKIKASEAKSRGRSTKTD